MPKDEIGRTGQQRYGGVFYEEFLPELRGQRGIRAYKEMSENDDIIGAILFAVKMLIRNVHWGVQPGGAEAVDARRLWNPVFTTWRTRGREHSPRFCLSSSTGGAHMKLSTSGAWGESVTGS